jgi:hypothetical protein
MGCRDLLPPPPTPLFLAVGLGLVAVIAQGLQVVVIICTAFGLVDDVIAECRVRLVTTDRHATIAQALLTQPAVTLNDAQPLLIPVGAVTSLMPRPAMPVGERSSLDPMRLAPATAREGAATATRKRAGFGSGYRHERGQQKSPSAGAVRALDATSTLLISAL